MSSGSPQKPEEMLSAFKDTLASHPKPWLLVYDNYNSPKEFISIGNMFPEGTQTFILMTSRHRGSLRLGAPVHVVDMDPTEAEDLLLVSSGLNRQEPKSETLKRVVERLGCLPLALDQA